MGTRDTFMNEYGYNYLCYYYKRDKNDSDLSEMVYETTKRGPFWAKILQPETAEKSITDSVFMFDSSAITLKTRDMVRDIEVGDRIEMRGKRYLVANKETREVQSNVEFDNEPSIETFISIKGA
jgi:hypothetical protein